MILAPIRLYRTGALYTNLKSLQSQVFFLGNFKNLKKVSLIRNYVCYFPLFYIDNRTFVLYNGLKVGDKLELTSIKGIGPKKIDLLNKLGIYDTNNLINFYPFRYEVIKRSDLDNLDENNKAIIDGVVETIPSVFHFNKKMDKMSFKLNSGTKLINIVIFNRSFLKSNLKIGTGITLIGKYDKKHNTLVASEIRFGKILKESIEPVYHTTYGLTGKNIKGYIDEALKKDFDTDNLLPSSLEEKYKFKDKKECLKEIHHPTSLINLKKARNRFKYEELFIFMLKMEYLKNNKLKLGLERSVDYSKVEEFISNLPFELTSDQLKAVKDIHNDLNSKYRMNRLLQGDVGSGKTIVAIIGMYINYLSGYQSALMAPTEILAIQHYQNMLNIFKDYDIKIGLLTGKLKAKEKKEIYKQLESGEINIIIGTHALISEAVTYKNLGLVITDEQHRFGVNQRSNLKNKGITPDILYMSATPIPRTYAITLYGDMDVSNIKTLPGGKKEIITTLKSEKEIKDVLMDIYNELKEGHQVYVVSPLIEDSEDSDLENVYKLEEKFNKAFGKLYKVGILHGKMTNDEKDKVMNDFKDNKINILISTTVIEVGIDVKNATMMVIFDAYRFGLSALHQLRGRVGRNNLQSYCILISNKETKRLSILTKTNDGFKISEEDFQLRGSGDLFGFRQSGDMIFKIANIKNDYPILLKAKEDAANYINNNPNSDLVKRLMEATDLN